LTELPIRRVLWVLLAYALGVVLMLPALDFVQRLLALPPLFGTLARGGMILGVPIAIFIAWRYPELGAGDQRLLDDGAFRDDNRPQG
jgi:hypothetical protein